MKTKLFFSIVIAICAFSACFTPRPISKLTAYDNNKEWYFGKEVLTQRKNDVEVQVIFDKCYREQLFFNVEVKNFTDNKLMVDPLQFSYRPYSYGMNEVREPVYAVNPEQMLLEVDKGISRDEASQSNNNMLSLVNTTTNLASDISDAKNNKEKTIAEIQEQERMDNQIRNTSIDYENQLMSLNQKREFWATQTIRKTTLPAKTKMFGLVCFNSYRNAPIYVFEYKIGNEVFRFKYKHELIRP